MYFYATRITYLRYRVNKDGTCLLLEKVDFVKNASPPQNVSELKSFLGLINYYHRHLSSFYTVLEPLHDLLRKSKKWKWGKSVSRMPIIIKGI